MKAWTQVGAEVNLDGIDTLTLFSEQVNAAGNLRVRIRQIGGDNGKRWNVDNIAVTDYASPYDYPADTSVVVGEITVLVSGGNANNDDQGTIPEFNNPGFTPDQTLILTLLGTGPWTITITTDSQWGAYYQNGSWNAVPNQNGTIVFGISEGTKDIPSLPIILGPVDPTLPIELSSFTAMINAQNYVSLMWVTQSETGVQGYYIYRAMNGNIGEAEMVSTMISATNTSSTQTYLFTDTDLYVEGTYYYWLQNVDFDGGNAFHGPVTVNFTLGGGGNDIPNIPLVTELKAIYPNPFNPTAFISYALSNSANVSFRIYNSRGQIVRSFDLGNMVPGNHRIEWNGRDDQGNACSTGVYFVRMQAGKDSFVRKAVMIK
ncbi:MAG: FlgD immunoglobulin-like domain containing protein [Candidatus Cloacimonadaceae bacterium]|nr:FlgD immunoglobulin-like domain containing protein [Candidatus Cloacimonadaceae bacterium]